MISQAPLPLYGGQAGSGSRDGTAALEETAPATAAIVGAGYIGLEMADALSTRGLHVIQMEQLPEVLPTRNRQRR